MIYTPEKELPGFTNEHNLSLSQHLKTLRSAKYIIMWNHCWNPKRLISNTQKLYYIFWSLSDLWINFLSIRLLSSSDFLKTFSSGWGNFGHYFWVFWGLVSEIPLNNLLISKRNSHFYITVTMSRCQPTVIHFTCQTSHNRKVFCSTKKCHRQPQNVVK